MTNTTTMKLKYITKCMTQWWVSCTSLALTKVNLSTEKMLHSPESNRLSMYTVFLFSLPAVSKNFSIGKKSNVIWKKGRKLNVCLKTTLLELLVLQNFTYGISSNKFETIQKPMFSLRLHPVHIHRCFISCQICFLSRNIGDP